MINNDRIVPIQKQDLLTMYGTILNAFAALSGESLINILTSSDVEGDFSVTGTGDAGTLFANQPVKTLDFASGVTAGVVFFVPAYDYAGFTVAGSAATIADESAAVNPDGVTLYAAALSSGEVTISAVSPVLNA